jgi:hypothetical protein
MKGIFQVWDYCADSDCKGCCTKNQQGTGFLLDIDSTAAQRVFGVKNAENSLYTKALFKKIGTVNPSDVCRMYGCKNSK